jgi:hypothetical protein
VSKSEEGWNIREDSIPPDGIAFMTDDNVFLIVNNGGIEEGRVVVVVS